MEERLYTLTLTEAELQHTMDCIRIMGTGINSPTFRTPEFQALNLDVDDKIFEAWHSAEPDTGVIVR